MYKIKKISDDKTSILDMPNIEMPTMGGHVFWTTEKEQDGYKLQVNMFTKHARILDSCDYRIAWGSKPAMVKKFKILTCDDELKAGDVIGVKRIGGIYEHYAVYIGNDEVIHYAGTDSDFSKPSIHRAPMSEFLKDSKSFFALDFPDEHGRPTKVTYMAGAALFGNIDLYLSRLSKYAGYHLYSPEETVQRAKSKLGETAYNLVTNNCEHFAIWCKTGVSESYQVEDALHTVAHLPVIPWCNIKNFI